jgi:hypothetical protein
VDSVAQAYLDAFEQHHHQRPKLRISDRKYIKDLIRDQGYEDAVKVATTYPGLNDRWLREQGWALKWICDRAQACLVSSRDICTDPDDLGWYRGFDGKPLPGEEWRFTKEGKKDG